MRCTSMLATLLSGKYMVPAPVLAVCVDEMAALGIPKLSRTKGLLR